jgi:hypothetical protein
MTTDTTQANINSYLTAPIAVGEPDHAGPLAVFPLFGADPKQSYVSFAQGRTQGVTVKELDSGASVGDLLVENPTAVPLLLYEGEEVLGAQQNRTFDISVLVPAGAKLRVPVSCVEVGRWDGSRHGEAFRPAPQAAYPELRRAKNRHARERLAAGAEVRADQAAVWDEVSLKSARHGTRSATGAMHDVYESRRESLAKLGDGVQWRDGQCGALVAIGGRFAVLDFVSRAEVFASLHGPLVQGYALDALETSEADPPSLDEARGFLALVTGSQPSERDGMGLGRELRFCADGVAGVGLVAGEELIQLTAFPEESGPATARGGRIRRPSRRRP